MNWFDPVSLWLFIFIKILCYSGGVAAFNFNNICKVENADKCLISLIRYEKVLFPLYGTDSQLDKACNEIPNHSECITSYKFRCKSRKHPQCDDKCKVLISNITEFRNGSGLKGFRNKLCKASSPFRELYLENYSCLEKNTDAYEACHKDSNRSLEYINTLTGPGRVHSTCCLISWQYNCFVNVTRTSCSENATSVVSHGITTLTEKIFDKLCKGKNISCGVPPSPPPPQDEVNELNTEKFDKNENALDSSYNAPCNNKNSSCKTPPPTSENYQTKLNTDKARMIEYPSDSTDNIQCKGKHSSCKTTHTTPQNYHIELDTKSGMTVNASDFVKLHTDYQINSAAISSHSVRIFVLSYCFIVFFKYPL